ncbi:MAG: N-6 DNA methylase [Gammaproteobacteria bacterium]|nr:N-6 DNA methylase [Gammaproteobacteria bacterium]
MLDNRTKRRIDAARDTLVGKVPDPKSQVEQITVALIYKFMADMDNEAESVGGKRSFFAGDFERYRWEKLMSPGMGGHGVLNLYAEAIARMSANPGIPQLFRDIFKNTYLPYRDPETLRGFLKIIDDFQYDHSEHLGDAYEYLLSVLDSQGDAGQVRTPHHIIDFIVDIVAPQKHEVILDPACGTAGFLISAWKYIRNANAKDGKPGTALTPDERRKLARNISGYDISPNEVRLSLVNMYLHGFAEPHIHEYDTLTSEERWNENADVILANPPFMEPKGGIRPHGRFSIQSKRSEVLFVDYIAEHLTSKGRAAVIVPESIISQSDRAYKQLREMLVENYVVAVISLPKGVFNPYSAIKTSILFMDKPLAKKIGDILFVKVKNDGYDLGKQRHRIDKNDLPEAAQQVKTFFNAAGNSAIQDIEIATGTVVVSRGKINKSVGWDLSGERYKENTIVQRSNWPMVALEDILDYEQPTNYIVSSVDYSDEYETPVLTAGKTFILGYTNEKNGVFPGEKLPVIIFDDFTTAIKFVDFPFKVKSSAMKILHAKKEIADVKFVFYVMKNINFQRHERHRRYWISQYSKTHIPLPPLNIQRQTVAEVQEEEKTIDANKALIRSHKQKIKAKIAAVWGEK